MKKANYGWDEEKMSYVSPIYDEISKENPTKIIVLHVVVPVLVLLLVIFMTLLVFLGVQKKSDAILEELSNPVLRSGIIFCFIALCVVIIYGAAFLIVQFFKRYECLEFVKNNKGNSSLSCTFKYDLCEIKEILTRIKKHEDKRKEISSKLKPYKWSMIMCVPTISVIFLAYIGLHYGEPHSISTVEENKLMAEKETENTHAEVDMPDSPGTFTSPVPTRKLRISGYTVAAEWAEVWENPYEYGTVLHELSRGTRVDALNYIGSNNREIWYEVLLDDGRHGWINRRKIKTIFENEVPVTIKQIAKDNLLIPELYDGNLESIWKIPKDFSKENYKLQLVLDETTDIDGILIYNGNYEKNDYHQYGKVTGIEMCLDKNKKITKDLGSKYNLDGVYIPVSESAKEITLQIKAVQPGLSLDEDIRNTICISEIIVLRKDTM